MTGIDEVILCGNKTKNAGIVIDTVRLFNVVSVQKNKSKQLGYLFTIPKPKQIDKSCMFVLNLKLLNE